MSRFKVPGPVINKEDWPPDYTQVYKWRQMQLQMLQNSEMMRKGAIEYYRNNKIDFVNHWIDTFDPRNAKQSGKLVQMPFIFFGRQAEFFEFLDGCQRDNENGLVEKARDMGATWACCAYSVAEFLFSPGASIGWGSRKSQLVDTLGDMDSIFEKMRMIIKGLPPIFYPPDFDPYRKECMSYMKIISESTGSSITGEAGDNIGRGGRKSIYFKDESAHYERPEMIEAALSANTFCQIDISSVRGVGNPFHRKRENGQEWSPSAVMEEGRTRVFVMDVLDHPVKTSEWVAKQRRMFETNGMLHIFEQEIMRNYYAGVDGIIINAEHLEACVDAHIKLGLGDDGDYAGALDVADGGIDTNASIIRKGIVACHSDEWGSRDPGVSTRRFINSMRQFNNGNFVSQYDSIGLGASVKSEYNRLVQFEKDSLPPQMVLQAWNAAGEVIRPKANMIEGDKNSPKNGDYYENIKAQAWETIGYKVYITWRAVNEPDFQYNPADIISISSSLPHRHKLIKELSQAVRTYSSKMKVMVDKTPEGTKSPNLGDAFIMCYFPVIRADTRVVQGFAH